MILQCDDRQLRAGLARRRATKVSNYSLAACRKQRHQKQQFRRSRDDTAHPRNIHGP